jgi:hypothetical protein
VKISAPKPSFPESLRAALWFSAVVELLQGVDLPVMQHPKTICREEKTAETGGTFWRFRVMKG